MDDARLQTFILEDGDEVRGSRRTLLTTYLLLKGFSEKRKEIAMGAAQFTSPHFEPTRRP